MSDLNIAVVDDEQYALNIINGAVEALFKDNNIAFSSFKYLSAQAFLDNLSFRKFDVIFLDIEMPEMDGIEVAEKVNGLNSNVKIIFVSNRLDKVFDTFKVYPFAFIRKTNLIEDLGECIKRIKKEYVEKKEENYFVVQKLNSVLKIPYEDIIYIESEKNTQILKTISGEQFELHSNMGTVEKMLSGKWFYRVQRSYIVNLKYVKKITHTEVILSDNEAITLTRGIYKDLEKMVLSYVQNNNFLF